MRGDAKTNKENKIDKRINLARNVDFKNLKNIVPENHHINCMQLVLSDAMNDEIGMN